MEDLLGWTMDRTSSFPKSQRHTFGQRLDSLTMEILELCIVARFDRRQREKVLWRVNLTLEKLRVLWRIVEGRRWIGAKQLLFVARRIDEVGRMAGAWRKASRAPRGNT